MVNLVAMPSSVRSAARFEGVPSFRFWLLVGMTAVLTLSAGWGWAQSASLLVDPALARFLALSNEQIQTLAAQHKAWRAELSQADQAVRKLNLQKDLGAFCAQMHVRESKVRDASRSVLSASQQTALELLSQAYSQMPLIAAAQGLQLIGAELTGVPAGFPEGSIEVEYRYVRASPELLPGCPAKPSRPFNTQQRDGTIPRVTP